MPDSRAAALIYNPAAGRRRQERVLDAILHTCRAQGYVVDPMPTTAPGQASDLAAAVAREGRAGTVFALGGDGTAREVAAGLMGSPLRLGILPGGTVNLMARALGLPRDPVAAAAALCQGSSRRFDVGVAGRSPFLMMVSAGLDARALAALDHGFKSKLGRAAVLLQGIREWSRYTYPPHQVIADGKACEPATFVAVCNIPYYAGPFRMAPAARSDSRRFELVTFHGRGRAATLAFILGMVGGGRHLHRKDVQVRTVEEVEIQVPAGSAVQVDGDIALEATPLMVRLAPEPLNVLAPP